MNDEEVSKLELQNSPENNPNFPVSKPITKEDFDKIPRAMGTHFTRGKDKEKSCYLGLDRQGCYVYISSTTENLSAQIPQEKLNLYTVEEEARKIVYPRREKSSTPKPETGLKPKLYWIDDLRPRKVEGHEIPNISPEDLAKLITETPGKGLIFYTGAGISTAGEVPVWNMLELTKEIGVDDSEATGFNVQFKDNPEQLLAKVNHFRDTLFVDASTPAHVAIAEIVKVKPGSVVFTENADLKHEAEGSRISVIHAGRQTNDFLDVRLRAPDAKLLITVGLSIDDRAIIAYLKLMNPRLKIVSVNLGRSPYLDNSDAVVLGNCQEILPKVAQFVKSP